LHNPGDAHRVVAIAFVDLHPQGRLGMPGIDADDGQSQLIQLRPKPRRCCSRLEPNPCDMRRMQFDEYRDRLRIGRNYPFPFDLSCSIDNADRCQLQ
jgi:hypothetical protein